MSIHKDDDRRQWYLGADADDERVAAVLAPTETDEEKAGPQYRAVIARADFLTILGGNGLGHQVVDKRGGSLSSVCHASGGSSSTPYFSR
jgi:hypothetical protein